MSTIKIRLQIDIVKNSVKIRQKLLERFTELNLTYQDVCNDAGKYGRAIHRSNLSRFFKQDGVGNFKKDSISLSHELILWLCKRWGIEVSMTVKKLQYNEKQCIKELLKHGKEEYFYTRPSED